METSKQTSNHQQIKQWAEERNGVPTRIKGTGNSTSDGVLRIHFPEHSNADDFEEISWDDFFETFDDKNLNFLYQDEKEDGETSTFHKFVNKD
ncbi:hypothetical protein BCY91_08490 [Pelobium manganitolerans]|uniref:1,4-alpha-glucan branching enzyme n=1 Tax=Pelobium manganitolerans TaxID=1842495 RepID=A0A419S4F0_9SPHI|nr:hypothetical protein [Pelobium manganitolerans]RKD14498.1 hypothetical protein BCY91_08490 [Pelobium manganitolerans]